MIEQDILQSLKNIEPEFIAGLKKILSINSVKGNPEPNAPFGSGPKEALEETLTLAKQLGFNTAIVNNAMGYAQLGDNNEDYVAVVGHLDVVHEGTGWDMPPFDLTLIDDVYYGRGVLDNKGPIIANLYALAALKRLNYPFNKTIRIIFGTDEESGSADIPLYLKQEKPPIYGYTPDCKYPAVYGERGILGLEITFPVTDGSLEQIQDISGSLDRSSVPDEATISWKNGNKQTVIGKRSPSNAPELGLNAMTLLASYLVDNQLVRGDVKCILTWVTNSLHQQHNGESIGINFSDNASGVLALTPFLMKKNKDSLTLPLSIRYPISVTKQEILDGLSNHLPSFASVSVTRDMPSTQFPVTHPMVKTMTKVYESRTGLEGTPVTTTGATYARYMPNIIAFGPSFPGQKGIAHNKNEYMDRKDLLKNLEIYAFTLAALGK